MVKMVWKQLRPDDLSAFREHLATLPAEERPVYGLLGVKAWWWARLGGWARPFVVLIRGERIILYQRAFRGRRPVSRREYRVADLQGVSVRRGPLLESARLSFADGYSVRVGSLPRRQSDPVERFLQDAAAVLDPSRLTPEQLTNTCLACEAMGLLPQGLLKGRPRSAQS
jgi:hypothetical protein